jgi:isoquinoline 1-oxidoreductase alpha subunit
MAFTISVNGSPRSVDVDGDTPLLWVLRDVLGMTGTKFGCGMALCGACTVHVDGVATRSCSTAVEDIGDSEVTTIEAIGATPAGAAIQKAWLDREVVQCGACTVHIDGVATRSCATPIDSIGTSEITTIEAIGATAAGAKIQKAWLDREVVQCGYCQSGQIMSASALLASNPDPTDADIDEAMSGNICRCGTYVRIRHAIKQAAQSQKQGG